MKTSPDTLGQIRAPTRPHHSTDALVPICEINEQCLQMLVETARTSQPSAEPFIRQFLTLIESLDATTLATASRFPFLLVDFSFRDPEWWKAIATGNDSPSSDVAWLSPFPRTTTTALASRISETICYLRKVGSTRALAMRLCTLPPAMPILCKISRWASFQED